MYQDSFETQTLCTSFSIAYRIKYSRYFITITREIIDNQVWRSNEDITNIDGGLAASCEDLSPTQTFVHKVNYSESENDFQALKVDETLFESRSKSEAQLSKLGVSAVNPKELMEFYDIDKPHSSPRKKDYFSTGDVSVSRLTMNIETLLQEEPESPYKSPSENDNQQLASELKLLEPQNQENNQQQTSISQSSSEVDSQQITSQHDVPQAANQEYNQQQRSQQDVKQLTNQLDIQQSPDQRDTQEATNQTDNHQQPADQHDTEETTNQQDIQKSTSKHNIQETTDQQNVIQDGDDQLLSSTQQEDTASDMSDGSLRERLTGTPDSGVVLSEDTSSQDQSSITQEEKHNEGTTIEIMVTDHDALSPSSSAPQLISNDRDSVVVEKKQINDAWETVANRKQRYLEMIEQDTSSPKLQSSPRSQPLTRKQIYKPEQTSPLLKTQRSQPLVHKQFLLDDQESEKDSDFDEELLSSSQPMLNLTNNEDLKTNRLINNIESDSDSETEGMQAPLIPKTIATKRVEAKDDTHIMDYTNPSLSDSSDDDDDTEMVKPDTVVIYRSPAKTAKGEQRVSHPPLQRTIRNEYFGSLVSQHSVRKRKHQPKLNSIIEEDH